jgi:hypothetical protein
VTAPAGSGAAPARDGDTRLAEIAARAEAATPGPWVPEPLNPGWVLGPAYGIFENMIFRAGLPTLDEDVKAQQRADGEFAAAARDDVPWLLAEVERLRAERDGYARANEILRRKNDERVAAVAALNRVRDEVGEPDWEYGLSGALLKGGGRLPWIPESRGEHYALHRRRVWHGQPEWIGDGRPVVWDDEDAPAAADVPEAPQ